MNKTTRYRKFLSENGAGLEVKHFGALRKIMEQMFTRERDRIVNLTDDKLKKIVVCLQTDVKAELSKRLSEFSDNIEKNFNVSI